MKKILSVIAIALMLPILQTSNANAGETGEPVGGFAIVNPATGVVHGVIVGSIEYFGGNNRTMDSEFMGCPIGCLIIKQSTSDQNGNVAGIHGPNVTYNQDRNVFQSTQTNTVQTETVTSPVLNETVTSSVLQTSVTETSVTETTTASVLNTSVTTVTSSILQTFVTETVTSSALNTYVVETSVSVNRPKIYEFGVQDLTNTNGAFQLNEVAPTQNTSVQISGYTKKFVCEDASETCSKDVSNTSSTLSEEAISFSERKTVLEVSSMFAAQNLTLLQSKIERLLILLGLWLL
jgi:hypothetical protein